MSKTRDKRIVQLERCSQGLVVSPAIPELAKIKFRHHVGVFTPRRGYQIETCPSPVMAPCRSETAFNCWAGLEAAILRHLQANGYEVHIINPVPPLLEPAWERLTRFEPLDRPLLECIRAHDRALCEYGVGVVQVAHIAAQICLAWPDARVAILVRKIDKGRALQGALGAYGVYARFAHHGPFSFHSHRVVLATYTQSSFHACDYDSWDIVICVEAELAIAALAKEMLCHARRARLYGLIPMGTHLAPLDRHRLHMLFGFRRVVLPRHGCKELPIDVVFTRVAGGRCYMGNDVVQMKRDTIWRNWARNRQLTRLGVALAIGDRTMVARLCPDVENFLVDRPGPNSVVMLVENDEHCHRLLRELEPHRRHWPRQSGFGREAQIKVATFNNIGDVDWQSKDYVVRADGGVGLPPFHVHSLTVPSDCTHRLRIIDVNDRDVPVLRRRKRQRENAYLQRGWLPSSAEPHIAEIDRFLKEIGLAK